MSDHLHATATTAAAVGRRALPLAFGFLAFYLAADLLSGLVADDALPRPEDPDALVRDYYVDNGAASIVAGVCQILSALCLAGFADHLLRRVGDPRIRPWARVSAVAFMACGLLAIAMAFLAPEVDIDTLMLVRELNFLAGGVVHVVTLGIFTWLASRSPWFGRGLRIFGSIAAALAVASLLSLVFYYANAFLPLGRLACMLWAISASVSLLRSTRRTPTAVA